jgi:hypothetical protein
MVKQNERVEKKNHSLTGIIGQMVKQNERVEKKNHSLTGIIGHSWHDAVFSLIRCGTHAKVAPP